MKRKRLNRDQWGFSHFPYYQLRMDNDDFHGTVCIIQITGGDYAYWEMPKAGRIAVRGEGMTWMELIPDGQKRVITVKYFPDWKHDPERINYPSFVNRQYQVSVWYVDVTDGVSTDEDGVLAYTDKYLDVIFSPEGDITVDDRDELDDALAAGNITDQQYKEALKECDTILKDLTEDIPGTEARCARIRKEAEKRLLKETEKGIRNFSTFLGRAGIYLEDLYVKPEFRAKGYGKALLTELARIAVSRGCGRLEWSCLNRNKPSIDFYLSMGATPMNDWTTYRITGDCLLALEKNDNGSREYAAIIIS